MEGVVLRPKDRLSELSAPLAISAGVFRGIHPGMTGTAAVRIARIVLVLSALHLAAAQTALQGFLHTHLQSFEAEAKFTPQTRKQRLNAYLLTLAGPATLVIEASAAGLSQAIDSPSQWRQGAAGYGMRFANDLAYNGVACSLTFASSILMNKDNRYFASGEKGAGPRVRHALVSVFTAHKRDGRTVFATSRMVGIAGASLISRTWSPESWRTPTGTAISMAISVGGNAGYNLAREFLPDIVHRLHQ